MEQPIGKKKQERKILKKHTEDEGANFLESGAVREPHQHHLENTAPGYHSIEEGKNYIECTCKSNIILSFIYVIVLYCMCLRQEQSAVWGASGPYTSYAIGIGEN